MFLSQRMMTATAGSTSGYTVSQSIRFNDNDSAHMSRTPSIAGSSTKFTKSVWVKRGNLGIASVISSVERAPNSDFLGFQADDTLRCSMYETYEMRSTNVFRDTSAWYHIFISYDSSIQTWSMYVNGTEVTYTAHSALPASYATGFNNTTIQYIGRQYNSTQYADMLMAEYYHIDGQTLSVTDFGKTDSYGNWVPIAYTGAYGTNGFHIDGADSGDLGKDANAVDSTGLDSVEFDGSTDFGQRGADLTGGTTDGKSFLWSGWYKRGADGNSEYVVANNEAGGGTFTLSLTTSNKLYCYAHNAAVSAAAIILTSDRTITVADGWVHFMVSVDGTNEHMYINGVDELLAGFTHVDTNTCSGGSNWFVGAANSVPEAQVDGQLADIIYDAQYIDLSSSINRDKLVNSDGTPRAIADIITDIGTPLIAMHIDEDETVTNFFQNNDGSGGSFTANGSVVTGSKIRPYNANDFTTSGLTSADQMLDSPTDDAENGVGNYATWNPLEKNASCTLSDGNLLATGGASQASMTSSTIHAVQGQYIYCEALASATTCMFGVFRSDQWAANFDAIPSEGARLLHIATGDIYNDTAGPDTSNYAPNDTVPVTLMLAIDLVNDLVYWGDAATDLWSNGTGTYNQAFGTATGVSLTAGKDWKVACRAYAGSVTLNTGQSAFTGTKPAGYSTLNTGNLPAPAITDPSEHHQVELVAHDGTSTAFTCNWDADVYDTLFIIKNRDAVEKWYWVDGLNGYGTYITSVGAAAAVTDSNVITVSGTTITLGSTLLANNYVVECHRAGLAGGVTNTDGTITSQVSVNSVSGFALGYFTGTGANATVGHGMGVTPDVIHTKCETTGYDWKGNHIGLTDRTAYSITLGSTAAEGSGGSVYYNSTAPTSTLYSIGTNAQTNPSGLKVRLYAWYGVEGYSAFGKYTGNGSADGPFVDCGFRPTSIVLKKTSAAGTSWYAVNSKRLGYNENNNILWIDTTGVEDATDKFDILSNGFKPRSAWTPVNASATYVYAAFAEHPFGGSGVSQARAR